MRFIKEFVILFIVAISIRVFSKETRKVIAVVDTGIPTSNSAKPYLCKDLQFDVTGYGVADVHGHGTNILGLIAKGVNTKTHCLAMIKWWHNVGAAYPIREDGLSRIQAYSKILKQINPVVVNMSIDGIGFSTEEFDAIKFLLGKGAVVVVSAGNSGQNLNLKCDSYPACYPIINKRFHIVGATRAAYSNFGNMVTDFLPGTHQCGIFGLCMSGTSQSAANKTATLIKEMK
jgi:subtilisin family serine protease